MDTKLNAIVRATLCQYQKLKFGYTSNSKDAEEIRTFLEGVPMLIEKFNKNDFNKYIVDNKQIFNYLIWNTNHNMLSQPVILLISYSLHKYCNNTIENWPFSYDALNDVLEGLGYSSDILFDA